MADPAGAVAPKRRRVSWRAWLRACHRDAGYLAVGLTVMYAGSGLALNHVADWDPNFTHASVVHELGVPLAEDDEVAARWVMDRLAITGAPDDVYRAGDELTILLGKRTLKVDALTGHVVDEEDKPRFLLRVSNWLHTNRGKKAWAFIGDAYAIALLFLAGSGLFMLAGRKGLLGRGAVFVALGIAVPVLYIAFAGGP